MHIVSCFGWNMFRKYCDFYAAGRERRGHIQEGGQDKSIVGDFIEAAYPFMERSVIVNGFAYLAGGLSTEILYSQRPEDVLSSAYLPFGLCIVLANDVERMTLACGVAFVISFLGTVIGNIVSWRKTPNEVEDTDSNILSKKEK